MNSLLLVRREQGWIHEEYLCTPYATCMRGTQLFIHIHVHIHDMCKVFLRHVHTETEQRRERFVSWIEI